VTLRSARDAHRQIKRVQVAATCVKGRAVVAVRGDERADLLLLDVADVRLAVLFLQPRNIAPGVARVARLMVRVQQTRAVVAFDAIAVNQ
jgi:hypothetical protein